MAFDNFEDEEKFVKKQRPMPQPIYDATGKTINQQPVHDNLVEKEVRLRHNNEVTRGKVVGRTVTDNGLTCGTYSNNPYHNTIVYDVEFPDGSIKEYAASILAENVVEQVDKENIEYALFDNILDHHERLTKGDSTEADWFFKVLWKDGNEEWVPFVEFKSSHPIEVAEYVRAQALGSETPFYQWVHSVLSQRKAIVSKIKARAQVTHKYGVKIPRTVQQAFTFDKMNSNTMWEKAIEKETTNVGIAFQILNSDDDLPVGYKKVTGHLIFDVKMDFTRKARFVLDGHKTEQPDISTYAGVVSRESIRIALTYAALNKLQVYAADIQNAYLQAPSSQKHYQICGEEFGRENIGKRALIRRALYGGKTAGSDFRYHLRACMKHLNFKSCLTDPDVWIRPAMNEDGQEYYEYVLLWTDDCLVISHRPEVVLHNEIGKYFKLKEGSIGPPKIYLGGKMR